MSSKAPFDDWSREEKDEFANQRMNKMRELNEKLMKRHQEVNQDRMDFERENPSAQVLLPTKNIQREEKERLPKPLEKKSGREWDAGKTLDGDWASDQQDFRYSRPNRGRGGFHDDKRNQRDVNWKNADSERRDNSYGFNNPRGMRNNPRGMRNQDSNMRNSFHSQNANTYRRPGGRYPNRTNNSTNRDFKNWNNDSKKQQFSTSVENDPVWRNDELIEARNKQSRVENWVQSVSTEVWSDSDEFSYAKKQSNSKTKTVKYDKNFEEPPGKSNFKNYNRRTNQEKSHKSSTSDSSHKEDGRPRYDRFQTDRHTSNPKESVQRNYTREKFKKHQFNNTSTEYRNKSSFSVSTKQRDSGDNTSWNNPAKDNKTFQNNKSGRNWNDKNDIGTKTAWGDIVTDKEKKATDSYPGKGGTWSDQEENDQVGGTSKNTTSDWDQQVSNSAKWENPEAGVLNNSQRRNNSTNWNNQKYSERNSNFKANPRQEQTRSRIRNDQESSWRDSGRNQNRNFKKPNKVSQWKVDPNHINNETLDDSEIRDKKTGTNTAWGSNMEKNDISKSAGNGGTWSDQEDTDQVEDTSKNITSGWDQHASNTSNWENSESTIQNNSQRHNNIYSGISQRHSEKTNNHKGNQRSDQTSSGNWSDQEDSERETEKNQNRNFKKPEADLQWGVESDNKNHQSLCMTSGKDNTYEKNEIEAKDLTLDNDAKYVSKNNQNDPEKVNEDMSDRQICEDQEYSLSTYENEASTFTTVSKQPDYDCNNEKSLEKVIAQDQIKVQVSGVQIHDGNVERSEEDYSLQKSTSQENNDQDSVISLEKKKDEDFKLENHSDKVTLIENMECDAKQDNDCKNSLFSDESDLTKCNLKEIEPSKETSVDISFNNESVTVEAVSVLEKTMEGLQHKDCQSEHLNVIPPDNLHISITNNEQRKVQLVSIDMKDKVSTETSRGISNSLDLLEKSAVHEQSVEDDHTTGIISPPISESSGNAKHQPKEIESSSKEIELNCPKHSESSLELETNPGALTITDDNDGDNDWSTITDENESDPDEDEIVNDTNVNDK